VPAHQNSRISQQVICVNGQRKVTPWQQSTLDGTKLGADSIRLRFPLWHAGLAQAFNDARKFRIIGRIVAHVDVRQGLRGEAGMDLLELVRFTMRP
jgi:hypothetical protein